MAGTVKKTTTAKKPRATASAIALAKPIKASAAPKKKTAAKRAKVVTIAVSKEQIAMLAHRYWAERGFQHGHDAEDWLRAETELRGKAS